MYRWLVMATLLLSMAATIPALADDAADCGNVGTLLKTDPDRAVSACRRLADQGVAGAEYSLGIMYRKGQGVPQDYAEAAKWFRKAAEQGRADAQSDLGKIYENGRGVPRDFTEAANWYRKAADQAYAPAQYKLGLFYTNGQGVPQDYVQAHMWFSLSALHDETQVPAFNHRAEIEAKMTTEQIAQAQALFAAWTPTWAR